MANKRVLVSTLAPGNGGVTTMLRFVVQTLRKRGYEPVLAHYEPYSLLPSLSVPGYKLLQRRVNAEIRNGLENCEVHAIGAWLPELEFTHYWATGFWREVMDSCGAFVTVSGNALTATAYWQTGRPFLAWIATDWEGDRKDRVKRFPWPRKVLDRTVNGPVIKHLEKNILRSGNILALSEYTAHTLKQLAENGFAPPVLSMPLDAELFQPRPDVVAPRRIGFTGRFDDPRKNIALLLEAAAILNAKRDGATVVLIGATPSEEIRQQTERLGLQGRISYIPHLSRTELCMHLQMLDVFVLPSYQEGLCISALEAMACGVPVVSTRCGGPEEFVIAGQTGMLVDFDAWQMAQTIEAIVADRNLRARLSAGARQLIEDRYTPAAAENIFWRAFHSTFPNLTDNQESCS